jgi:hypothetical protein
LAVRGFALKNGAVFGFWSNLLTVFGFESSYGLRFSLYF